MAPARLSISIIPRYRVSPVFGSPRTPVDGTGVERTLNAVILGHRLARKTHQQTSPEFTPPDGPAALYLLRRTFGEDRRR